MFRRTRLRRRQIYDRGRPDSSRTGGKRQRVFVAFLASRIKVGQIGTGARQLCPIATILLPHVSARERASRKNARAGKTALSVCLGDPCERNCRDPFVCLPTDVRDSAPYVVGAETGLYIHNLVHRGHGRQGMVARIRV